MHTALVAIALLSLVALPTDAQETGGASSAPPPLSVSPATSLEDYRGARQAIALTLSRELLSTDGELVVLVGTMDVTQLTSRSGTALTIEPGAFPLPSGESQIVVLTRSGRTWNTVGTIPVRILGAAGFVRTSTAPTLNLNSTGQIADGRTAGLPASGDRTQDVTLGGGFRSLLERTAFTVESQSNIVGATRDELALRFAQKGERAPLVDLSDYQVSFRRSAAKLDIGHVALGANRHLVSGFASRGVALTAGPSWAALTIGSVAGSPIVGWDNPVGFADGNHRINTASLGLELWKRRPGAMQVRMTAIDGSLLPRTGFTQGAVVDAEESRGGGVEMSAATPGQRARLAAGYSRSTFDNPVRDTQLVGGLPVVRVIRDRRAARYVEGNVGVLQNTTLFGRAPTSATLGVRHERVDPLFRSVGANAQADRVQDAVDLQGSVGFVALQGSMNRSRDNLANLVSVLTSRTNGFTSNVALPMAAVFRVTRHASWFPQLSIGYLATRQYADAPRSDEFRPQDAANQKSTSLDVAAQWQVAGWQVALRDNRSRQDNRQLLRERSDFSGSVQNASLGRSFGSRVDGSLDFNLERQRNEELAQVNTVRRAGLTGNWRITNSTTFSSNLTAAVSRTPPDTRNVTNLEMRAEAAHTVRLFGRDANLRTGQFFLRFARTSITAAPFGFVEGTSIPLGLATQTQWTLNSGLSLRLW
jgi:hypothetical protein